MVSKTQMIGQTPVATETGVENRSEGALESPPPLAERPQAKPALDPTRYGDWEKNGRCIDF